MNRRSADDRAQSALARVQRAQVELDEACSDLSAIIGMVPEWEKCGKLSDSVKAFWHRLNGTYLAKRGQWKTDADGNP